MIKRGSNEGRVCIYSSEFVNAFLDHSPFHSVPPKKTLKRDSKSRLVTVINVHSSDSLPFLYITDQIFHEGENLRLGATIKCQVCILLKMHSVSLNYFLFQERTILLYLGSRLHNHSINRSYRELAAYRKIPKRDRKNSSRVLTACRTERALL